MKLNKLDLNLLVVLDAIVQSGSFTAAARELHLSQPAVSHALARLRDALGDPLLVRQGRRMLPTPYARALMPSVRQALDTLQHGLSDPQRGFVPAESDRVFTLGMRDILEALTLPGLMAHIRQHAPGVSVNCIQVDRHDLPEALRQGRVDAALDIALPVSAEVHHTRLVLDRLMVVSRASHPLAQAGALTVDAYLAATHVQVSGRKQGLGLEDFELSRLGLRRQVGLRCRHYFAACRVVNQTDMLLTMPAQYAQVANAHFDNALQEFPLPSAQLDVHLYWHATQEADPTNAWLRQRIVDAVKAESRP